MRLQEFETRSGTHLTADDTLQIFFYRQFIDCHNLIRFYHKAERAQEGLGFLALPVEVDTDGYVAQRERGVGTLRMEGELAVLVAVPKHTALREFYHLLAQHLFALGKIRFVEREMNLLRTHDAHHYVGLLTIII